MLADFKYCYSKLCKNCNLKSIIKTHVQITYVKIYLKKHNYVFDMCKCFFLKLKSKSIIILFEDKESSLMWSNQMELTIFNIFT